MYISSRSRAPQTRQATPPLVDNPFAAELFATGCAGFTHLGGTVVLTLEAARCDHSGETPVVERVVAGRIALTIAGAQVLASGLNQFLEQQGLQPTPGAVSGGGVR
ncbi:hypothetical protein ACMGDM_17980 [Sphingomonas sp. DT-51]|uniref:hypothetical protein n=1 Tax=Sphingomonas sp. DT-51 TaxID=3396165 RepID=UPI003F1A44A2